MRRLLIVISLLLLAGAVVIGYIFTRKHTNTALEKPAYTVNAQDFIEEFIANDSLANKKYADQFLSIRGRVTGREDSDITLNIKVEFPTGSYLSFAFQQEDINSVKKLKPGDSISVKGSCNGGNYSSILEAEYITFKRCTLQP